MSMPPVQNMSRDQLQAEIDGFADGEELVLNKFEYPGPIVIANSITIDGQGATLWAQKGPLCQIKGKHVTLKNFRIEVTEVDYATGDPAETCALQVDPGCNLLLENVEVRGNVEGLAAEEGEWRYPYSIKLGDILHGKDHSFQLRLYVPVPCKLSSGVHGIRINPAMLSPGPSEVALIVDSPIRDALLLGSICIQTAFLKRQITICGHVVSSAQGGGVRQDGEILWEPDDWNELGKVQKKEERSIPVQKPSVPQPKPPPITPPPEPPKEVSPAPPPPSADKLTTLDMGAETSTPFVPPVRSTRIVRQDIKLSNVFSAPPPVETEAGSFEPKVNLSTAFGQTESANPPDVLESVNKPVEESAPPPPPRIQSQPISRIIPGGSKSIPISGVFGIDAEPPRPTPETPKEQPPQIIEPPEEKTQASQKKPGAKGKKSVPNIFLGQ